MPTRSRPRDKIRIGALGIAAAAAVVLMTSPLQAATHDIGPGVDWCAAANALGPGDELRLAPGDYPGPCTIRTGGAPGAPIIVRGAHPDARPRIVFTGTADNVVNLAASHVTLRGLAFGPTMPDVDAVRMKAGDDITVEDCTFVEIGGIAVVANNTTSRGITIRGNEILRSRATAVYLGCHDGASCRVTDILLEANSINGVDAPRGQIGYGIQVKLNSSALIRRNAIADTKGPGIMVYGARDLGATSVVERNVVVNSRTEAGIVIGGGAALVSNNIVVGGPWGIALEDYGTRGLLRGIVVSHNTVYGGSRGGITVKANRLDAALLYNAAHSLAGAALPDVRAGLLALGNVNCRLSPCFVDPLVMNFAPLTGSLLIGRGAPGPGVPETDLVGATRPPAATAGALELGSEGHIIPGRRLN